jgi:hypothetical protein
VEVRAKGAFHPGAGLHLCAGHAVGVPGSNAASVHIVFR